VADATYSIGPKASDEAIRAKRDADAWIKGDSKDYRRVCDWAGMDPDFIRDAYMSGRINREALRKSGVEITE